MTLLPIVERELRIAARLTATYRNRAIAAGVVAGVAIVMLLFGSFAQMPSLVGGAMFRTLAYLTFLFCALEGVRKTADCVSEEKREGTLGLLFLTDLKGYDIVFGKFAAMSLNSVYGLLAILPTLALPLLMGGVTPGEFWRMALALANILFFSLCAGMWISTQSHSEYQAMGRTLLLLLLVMAIPFLALTDSLYPLSPACAFHAAFDSVYPRAAAAYWRSLGITQLLSWALLAWSSFAVGHCWQEERIAAPRAGWWWRAEWGDAASRARQRTQMLDINPALWLAARDLKPRFFLSLLILAAGVNSAVYVFNVADHNRFGTIEFFLVPALVINFVMKSFLAVQACHCLAEARRNNALELLLSTPLTVQEIIRGQLLALKRAFLVPAIVLLGLEIVGPMGGLVASDPDEGAGAVFIAAMLFGTVLIAFFFIDMVAVTWTGMWFGLTSKKEGQAAAKTIIFVLVLPLFSLIFWCFGLPLFIGLPIFWLVWSCNKTYAELRSFASLHHAAKREDSGWLPVAGSPRV